MDKQPQQPTGTLPLRPQELEALLKSAHRPNYTCQVGAATGTSSYCSLRKRACLQHAQAGSCLPCMHNTLSMHTTPATAPPLIPTPDPPWPAAQVLTAVIKRAQLPGDNIDNYDSFANVKASAAFR